MGYERDNIRRMSGYTPGEQPPNADAIKLNTNENPYPPAPSVMEALAGVPAEALRRYPSPTSATFRQVAARHHGVEPEQIVATNGGDELLRLAITTFVNPGSPIGIAEPSYSLYPVLAGIHGSPVVRVALGADWRPTPDFAERMNRERVPLTLLVNPHAPSGTLLEAETIARLARSLGGVLLVDEAYVDFVDPERGHDLVSLLSGADNIMLLRTLSKGYSLAGLRFGYGIGPRGLIDPIARKTRDSYSVDAIAERLAVAALRDPEYARSTWAAVRGERTRLAERLAAFGLSSLASESNFLLVQVPEAFSGGAPEVYRLLREQGIFVRHFDQPGLRDRLRITVGTPEQNDTLLRALSRLHH
ncbi:histidinol-phosphate transaminase [Arhodomonas sp. SL1]|uniref:histidinol-phosphate transaminase n=1 Tax=Arhodomonas sp. SL1 TaxID=3425691 RepID=UPI003F885DDD